MKSLILASVLGLTQVHPTSFHQGYMSPQDLMMSLTQKFEQLPSGNSSVFENELQSMGDINLQTGDPVAEVPGTSFISLWDGKVAAYIQSLFYGNRQVFYGANYQADPEISNRAEKIDDEILIPQVFAPIMSTIDGTIAASKSVNPQSTITRTEVISQVGFPVDPVLQKQLVSNWVQWVLGSDEEILSYGRMQNVDQYRADLLKYLTRPSIGQRNLQAVTTEALKILFKRDEFLLYQ